MSRFIFLPFEVKGILKGHPVPYPAAYRRLAAFTVVVVGPCTEISAQTKRVFHAVRSGYETGVSWQWMVLDGKSWRQDGKENSKDA